MAILALALVLLPAAVWCAQGSTVLPERRGPEWTIDVARVADACEYMPPFNASFKGSPHCLRVLAKGDIYKPAASSPALTRPLIFHAWWAASKGIKDTLLLAVKSFLFTQVQPPGSTGEAGGGGAGEAQPAQLWLWLTPDGGNGTSLFTSADLDANGDIPFSVVSSRLNALGKPLPAALDCACIRFRLYDLPLLLSLLPRKLQPEALQGAVEARGEPLYYIWLRLLQRGSATRASSDVARYVLTYLFGGVYMDCDVLLLRDLRPLQHFAWAYRWSTSPHCNTAVMHAARGSSLVAGILRRGLQEAITRHAAARGGSGGGSGDGGSVGLGSLRPTWSTAFHPRVTCHDDGKPAPEPSHNRLFVFPVQLFDVGWLEKDAFTPGGWEGLPAYKDFLSEPGRVPAGGTVHDFMPGALAYHWHNQWDLPLSTGTWARVFSDAADRFLEGSGPNMYGERLDVKAACAAAGMPGGRTRGRVAHPKHG